MALHTSTSPTPQGNEYAAFAFRPASLKQPSLWGRMVSFVRKTMNITEWEVRKIRHDPTDLLTRAVQPASGCWSLA